MADSIQKLVLVAMKAKLEELPWVSLVDYERVRLFTADMKDHEVPLIQMYDIGESATQVRGRTDNTWTVTLELVLKGLSDDSVDQGILFDRKLEIKRKIGEDPTLGISNLDPSQGRFKHVEYVGSITDIHVLQPYYMARLDYNVLFEEPFSSEC